MQSRTGMTTSDHFTLIMPAKLILQRIILDPDFINFKHIDFDILRSNSTPPSVADYLLESQSLLISSKRDDIQRAKNILLYIAIKSKRANAEERVQALLILSDLLIKTASASNRVSLARTNNTQLAFLLMMEACHTDHALVTQERFQALQELYGLSEFNPLNEMMYYLGGDIFNLWQTKALSLEHMTSPSALYHEIEHHAIITPSITKTAGNKALRPSEINVPDKNRLISHAVIVSLLNDIQSSWLRETVIKVAATLNEEKAKQLKQQYLILKKSLIVFLKAIDNMTINQIYRSKKLHDESSEDKPTHNKQFRYIVPADYPGGEIGAPQLTDIIATITAYNNRLRPYGDSALKVPSLAYSNMEGTPENHALFKLEKMLRIINVIKPIFTHTFACIEYVVDEEKAEIAHLKNEIIKLNEIIFNDNPELRLLDKTYIALERKSKQLKIEANALENKVKLAKQEYWMLTRNNHDMKLGSENHAASAQPNKIKDAYINHLRAQKAGYNTAITVAGLCTIGASLTTTGTLILLSKISLASIVVSAAVTPIGIIIASIGATCIIASSIYARYTLNKNKKIDAKINKLTALTSIFPIVNATKDPSNIDQNHKSAIENPSDQLNLTRTHSSPDLALAHEPSMFAVKHKRPSLMRTPSPIKSNYAVHGQFRIASKDLKEKLISDDNSKTLSNTTTPLLSDQYQPSTSRI